MSPTWMRRVVAVVGAAAATTALCGLGLALGAFAGFQRTAADALFPSAEADDRVVVVGIDRTALQANDLPWPWPRDLQAEMITKLRQAGAAVVVVDLAYPTATDPTADAALADAVAAGPTVLAMPAGLDGSTDRRVPIADESVMPVSPVGDAASGIGHVASYAHPADGIVRTLPLVVGDAGGALIPAISLQALMVTEGIEVPTLRPDGVQVGDRFIPAEGGIALRLNFAADIAVGGPAYISANDVLAGRDLTAIEDAFVLVGVTDPTLGDTVPTPVAKGDGAPGVLVHAQALNTMLTSSYLTPVSDAETLMWVFVLAALVASAVAWLPLPGAVAATVVLGFVDAWVSFWRFERGHVPDLVYLNLGIVIAFVTMLGVQYVTETRQRRRIARLFARYVPPSVADQLVADDHLHKAERGHRVEVTVWFCDLRGFTAMAESMAPDRVRSVLDRFYEHMVAAIDAHDGTVMQFVGDEVFALWGDPLPHTDHRQLALDAAIDAQAAWSGLAADLEEIGADPVHYGIGVNTGEVVAGHVGGGDRLQYTVIGDAVNLGARLCSIAGPGEIVCSDDVYRGAIEPPPAIEIGPVDLKGISRDLVLWRVRATEHQVAAPTSTPKAPGPPSG